MIVNGEPGDIFYTIKLDKDVTAIASYYKRQVKTERVIVITTDTHPIAERITKVTIV
jgi:hypothetical protein